MPSGSKLAVRPEATDAEPPASEAAGVEKSSSAVLMLPATWHHVNPRRQQAPGSGHDGKRQTCTAC
jgi:hypothetical protein